MTVAFNVSDIHIPRSFSSDVSCSTVDVLSYFCWHVA